MLDISILLSENKKIKKEEKKMKIMVEIIIKIDGIELD
jgi:hypothetical protein